VRERIHVLRARVRVGIHQRAVVGIEPQVVLQPVDDPDLVDERVEVEAVLRDVEVVPERARADIVSPGWRPVIAWRSRIVPGAPVS
jgi:hypothetical protein